MTLIIGLGNPGEKYQNTWHNVGFSIINQLEILDLKNIILLKPDSFMNLSGKAVSKISSFYKIKPENIIIIHDEIDLFLGKIKISKNRGSAGHKGIESIIKELNTKNFIRIRVGIRPKSGKPKSVEKFVLKKINKQEQKTIEKTIKQVIELIEFFLKNNLEKTMNKFNK